MKLKISHLKAAISSSTNFVTMPEMEVVNFISIAFQKCSECETVRFNYSDFVFGWFVKHNDVVMHEQARAVLR